MLLLSFANCSKIEKEEANYSFFVAGHTYGKAGVNNIGLHPPFKAKFEKLRNYDQMAFGVLTGDIVFEPTDQDWEEVETDINTLGVPVYIALGNHEYRDSLMVLKRFEETYYNFKLGNDLHIILDPNLDQWNISGGQLLFLKKLLKESASKAKNIFVYFHQVLWWGPDNQFSDIRLNLKVGRDPNLNFWTEIVPLFQQLKKPIYMFAGDVGAASWADDCSYRKFENIHLIASGMGDGKGDNFVIVDVRENEEVKINLLPLDSIGGFKIESIEKCN